MAIVYIIYSEKWDRYYIGFTENISQRLLYHNSGKNKSTRGSEPWVLKYHEKHPSATSARKREHAIKAKKSRKYIEWLINSAEN